MKICITGSLGLVGLAACRYFLNEGNEVWGIDNNMRQVFFGEEGRTDVNLGLFNEKKYHHINLDIRDREEINKLFIKNKFEVVIHTAAQPSHDKAREIPLIDFEVNAMGTLNLLEACRKYCPKTIFIYTSTNKVYGDNPNNVNFIETKTRFDFSDKNYFGFDERTSVDQCLHSLFGVSKLAADTYVVEYAKTFGLKTTVFRLGCVTGGRHASVKLHGFLSYLVKSLMNTGAYQIIGYKGKQVRDQIDADDLILAMVEVIKNPKKGEVFNLGGGRENSISVLEAIKIVANKLDIRPKITYVNKARLGDHICYISDTRKFKKFYPDWKIRKSTETIIDEIINYKRKTLQILGVGVSVLTYNHALDIIDDWIKMNNKEYVCVSAVHLLMECQQDKKLNEGVNRAGLVTSDGMPLVWILKRKYPKVERVYGPDLTWKLCMMAQRKGYGVFFLGGAVGESKLVGQIIKKRYPKLLISGFRDTPVRPIPAVIDTKIIEEINKSGAKIVFVGLGCPMQEKWMIKNRSKLEANVLVGVGAAFDFITGRERQAPKFLQRIGMEWFFRLCQHPRRLWYRYLVLNSKFIYKIASEKWKEKKIKVKNL